MINNKPDPILSTPISSVHQDLNGYKYSFQSILLIKLSYNNMVSSAISLGSTALSVHLRRSPAPLLPPILCTTFTSHRSIFFGRRFAPISITCGRIDPRRPFAMAFTPIKVSEGKKEVLVFENEEELSVSLAKFTAELSEKYTDDRGAFTVVLSGGSLIKSLRWNSDLILGFFERIWCFSWCFDCLIGGECRKLVESPYVDSVNWGKWHVFWADERVVPKDHPDSNYKLALDGFLSKVKLRSLLFVFFLIYL